MDTSIQIFNYNGSNITMKNEHGIVYVNLTEVAKAFPEKNLSQIVNSQEIKEYVNELSAIQNYIAADLLIVKNGGTDFGTWAHQKVALRVCQKLSTQFAILVDTKIEELLTRGFTKLDAISRKDLAKMLLESEEENEQIAADKQRLLLTTQEQAKQLKEAAPKVQYYEDTLSSKSKITVNSIALCIGISHQKLNKLLCQWGIQYQQSGTYFLTAKYRNLGLAKHHPFPYVDSHDVPQTRQHLYWNESGKKFILELYERNCVTLETV